MPQNGKAVLITGCDSGFGFILAQDLQNGGCDVIATSIDPKGENPKKLINRGIKVVGCDVSKDKGSISTARSVSP